MEILIVFCAIVGAFFHWVKARYVNQRMKGNPIDYIITHPWNTVAAAGTIIAAVAAMSVTGVYENITISSAMINGFLVGYTADSSTNKGPESK